MKAAGLGALLLVPILLLVLPFLLLAGLVGGLAIWARTEAPLIPPPLEAYYKQAQAATGVPWAALAAWDGAANQFNLPVDPQEVIFNRLYQEALDRKVREWREWCEAHRDPDTGQLPSPECDSPPGLTEEETLRLYKQSVRLHAAAILQYITEHTHQLAARIELFATNPEAAFRGLVPDPLVPLANDLFEGYSLLVELDDADHLDLAPGDLLPPDPTFQPAPGFAWPAVGPITSRYGWRISPIDGQLRLHAGIDLGVHAGTQVHASKEGTVASAGFDQVHGWLVILAHDDGYTTWYSHNTRLLVAPGQRVEQGTVVALSGTSGWSTGPHLHFEIRRAGVPYDPLLFLGRP